MRNASGALNVQTNAWEWNDIPNGGRGYTSNIDIHSSGRQWIGTDSGGSYLRDPNDPKWTTIFTDANTTNADVEFANNGRLQGWSANWGRFAPSDQNRLYAGINAVIYKVDIDPTKRLYETGAITLTRWNLAPKQMLSGLSFSRWYGPSIAVHPTNKDIALLGTSNDGCYYTTDGGATVTAVSVPACTATTYEAPRYIVYSDPGDEDYWYIAVQGIGIYRSTAGVAGPYTVIASSPLGATNLFGDAAGNLYVCREERITTGGLSVIARGGSSFTDLGAPNGSGSYPWHGDVDPFDGTILVWREQIGAYSTNGGASWTSVNALLNADNGGDCLWRVTGSPKQAGGHRFDPTTQGRVLMTEGFGAVYALAYKTPHLALIDYSAGIEGSIDNDFATNPNTGRTMMASWDLPVTPIDSLTDYVNVPMRGPVGHGKVQIGSDVDWAIDDPDYWVATVGTGSANHCYSPDNGANWYSFPGTNPFPGPAGNIAVGNKTNIVIIQSNNTGMIYTKDGGTTWNPVLLNGSQDYPSINAASNALVKKLTADKSRPGTFAFLVSHYYKQQFRNSTFSTSDQQGGLSWWSAGASATLSVVTGQLNITNGAASQGYAVTTIYPTIGQLYSMKLTNSASSTAGMIVKVGTTAGASDVALFASTAAGASLNSTFTATANTLYVSIVVNSTTIGDKVITDNISCAGTPDVTNTLAGVWLTTDGGDTWTHKYTGAITDQVNHSYAAVAATGQDPRMGFHDCQLSFVPSIATHELLCTIHVDYSSDKFWWSQDDGATWAEVNTAIRNVNKFAFGDIFPGQTRPAVYFYGEVSGVKGTWLTLDWFTTFIKVSGIRFGGVVGGFIRTIGADPTTFGRVFGAQGGKGSRYSTYRDWAVAA